MTMPRRLSLLLVLVFWAVQGAAESPDPRRAMTPVDLARIQSITSAKISPDGATVAAVRTVPRELFDEPDGEDWDELYLVDRSGGGARPFVTGAVNVSSVGWRPDGSAVSFLARRGDDEHQRLYLIPTDGGEATPIISLGSPSVGYAWSPDGQRLAVIASAALTDEEEELAGHGFDQEVFEEDFKPLRLFVVELGGDDEPRPLDIDGSVTQVEWSPDGERLAVAVAPTPLVDDRMMLQAVRVVDPATGEVVSTIDRQGKLGDIRWSPDGRRLAMISAADLHDPSASSLLVAEATGGRARELTRGFEGSVRSIAWADAASIVFLADVGVGSELYRVSAGGGPLEALGRSSDGVVYSALSLANDGVHGALVGSSAAHPAEVFGLDLGAAGPPVRLTEANAWLADIRLAPQEAVRFRARDGLELEGVLIRPLHGADRPAPLVMVVHGGPEGHRSNGWLSRYDAPAQVLAGRGYAVFFPNYRGSTGRGVAFTKLGQSDAAGAEFDDLVDAVDHLVEIGVADPDRVGVTGGSYGGYATAWLATRYSERFAAGVMFVGISNTISKLGTTDIPREETLVHALGHPWDDWERAIERSPLAHAGRGRTPLLIAGGDADTRVSPTQGMELYRALRIFGRTPVRLVRYPGEGHGNLRAASRFDLQLRLLRWFDHYLGGPGGAPPPYRLDYRSPAHGWPVEDDG
ncbi:MAG: S9 family peptidase [Thermoanaerobaculales bacterium]|jgi:dipeptidyl aminopeptidase/acylaminoacyl peptidase|nr:S9 family peptidase [Thermoanaerobaculales bacterium]